MTPSPPPSLHSCPVLPSHFAPYSVPPTVHSHATHVSQQESAATATLDVIKVMLLGFWVVVFFLLGMLSVQFKSPNQPVESTDETSTIQPPFLKKTFPSDVALSSL